MSSEKSDKESPSPPNSPESRPKRDPILQITPMRLGGASGFGFDAGSGSGSGAGSQNLDMVPSAGGAPAEGTMMLSPQQILQMFQMSATQLSTMAPALQQLTNAGLEVAKDVKAVKTEVKGVKDEVKVLSVGLDAAKQEFKKDLLMQEFKFCREPPLNQPSLVLATYLHQRQYITDKAATPAFFYFRAPDLQEAVLIHPAQLALEIKAQTNMEISATFIGDILKRCAANPMPNTATIIRLLGSLTGKSLIKFDMTRAIWSRHKEALAKAEAFVHKEWEAGVPSDAIWPKYEESINAAAATVKKPASSKKKKKKSTSLSLGPDEEADMFVEDSGGDGAGGKEEKKSAEAGASPKKKSAAKAKGPGVVFEGGKKKKMTRAPQHFNAITKFFKMNPKLPDELLIIPYARLEEFVRLRLKMAAQEMRISMDIVLEEPFTDFKFGRGRIQLRSYDPKAQKKQKKEEAKAKSKSAKRKADIDLEDVIEEEAEEEAEEAAPPAAGAGSGSGAGSKEEKKDPETTDSDEDMAAAAALKKKKEEKNEDEEEAEGPRMKTRQSKRQRVE